MRYRSAVSAAVVGVLLVWLPDADAQTQQPGECGYHANRDGRSASRGLAETPERNHRRRARRRFAAMAAIASARTAAAPARVTVVSKMAVAVGCRSAGMVYEMSSAFRFRPR
jgi:hypothetical protein